MREELRPPEQLIAPWAEDCGDHKFNEESSWQKCIWCDIVVFFEEKVEDGKESY